eukprot:5688579-Pleurochrysis_carterae.AAC.9
MATAEQRYSAPYSMARMPAKSPVNFSFTATRTGSAPSGCSRTDRCCSSSWTNSRNLGAQHLLRSRPVVLHRNSKPKNSEGEARLRVELRILQHTRQELPSSATMIKPTSQAGGPSMLALAG